MSAEIREIERRLQLLETALLDGMSGDEVELEAVHDDLLGAIEVGVSVLIDALRGRVTDIEEINHALDERVSERTRELQQRLDELAAQAELIRRQRDAIARLSTPILQLWQDVIAIPIIGIIDTQRAADLTESLLEAVAQGRARYAILDITGVELLDTATAAHLLGMVRATRLLGSACVLTGVQPAVAQTMVALGLDLGSMKICRNLQAGLQACLLEMSRSIDDEP